MIFANIFLLLTSPTKSVKLIEDISIVGLATEVNGQLTQIDRNQGVEQDEDEPTLLTDVKDSDWIEVDL